MTFTKRLCIACAGLIFASANAHADTLVGTNFDVVYNPAAMGLFGLPSLSGNTVFFNPTNFKAESLNGAGIVTNNQTIVFDIVPHAGFTVTASNLVERGNYLLRDATSIVDVEGLTRGFAIANPLAEVTDSITAAAAFNVFNVSTNWTATSFLNLSALQADNRGYRITIANLLLTYTDSSATGVRQAFIEKQFTGETISLEVVGSVPEPEQWALLLAGLAILGAAARRRTSPQA
jgi:hypothetical protein